MQHPEEGIIHAWIDGALSPAEASRLEAHVAGCTECAARVAEARGLVAASSRIVGHLDAVPANVLPAAPKRRSWIRSPWPTAIAATLVVGISLYTSNETPPATEVAGVRIAPRLPDSTLLAVPSSRTAETKASAPPPPRTIEPSPSQRLAGNGPVAQVPAAGVGRAAVAADNQASAVDSAPPRPAPPSILSQTTITGASAPMAAAPAAARTAEMRSDSARAVSSMAVAAAGGGSARMQRAERARVQSEFAAADRADVDVLREFTGCYEMNVSTDILPARFALVPDNATGMPGLHGVRYIDASGRLSEPLVDAGWAVEGGRAVVKTTRRGPILTLTKAGGEVAGDSPNGPRTGRVASCR